MADQATNGSGLNHASPEVLKHVDMVQGIVHRMSDNSKSCKQWCVILIAGIFAIVAKQGSAEFAALAMFPLVLFCFLDTYYLTLERSFIDANTGFLNRLNNGTLQANELFKVKTERDNVISGMGKTFTSLAIWPFYCLIALMVFSAWYLVK